MITLNLANNDQQNLVQTQLKTLSLSDKQQLESIEPDLNIAALVDGRGLACPMPLLKTKVALRSLQINQSIYVLATDPNSQTDLAAFCHQAGLELVLSTCTDNMASSGSEKLDTIFHLIITKTNGN